MSSTSLKKKIIDINHSEELKSIRYNYSPKLKEYYKKLEKCLDKDEGDVIGYALLVVDQWEIMGYNPFIDSEKLLVEACEKLINKLDNLSKS